MDMNKNAGKQYQVSSCGGGSGCGGTGKWIWIALAAALAGVLTVKHAGRKPAIAPPAAGEPPAAVEASALPQTASEPAAQSKQIPHLVDLGADKCIPCKMMAPILEELKQTHAGRMDVVFIDVWENPDAAKHYGINVIPTQIFYDAGGKELFRHEGFFGKEDILAKWKELGVSL